MFTGLNSENARDPSPKPVDRKEDSIPKLVTKKTVALQGAWANGAPKSSSACGGPKISEECAPEVSPWASEKPLLNWGDESDDE